jgi:hypothetical protein
MLMNKEKIHHGGSCCGSVRYQAMGKPVVVAHCHCEDCQRISGAGHSTGAMFAASDVQISGQTGEYQIVANNGNRVTKGFCPNCGSPVFGSNSGSGDFITISLGTFDDSTCFEPQVIIFARNRKPWDLIDETLPTFDTQPDWKPADGI